MTPLCENEYSRHAVLSAAKLKLMSMQSDSQYSNGFEYGVRHLLSPRSGLISDIIMSNLDLSLTEVEELLQLGSVYLEGQRAQINSPVSEGAYIRVHTKPRRFPANDYPWLEKIIFQNENFLVVNKPAGLPVHASVDNTSENLQKYLTDFLKIEIFVTHRLDVPTSGLLVFAKTRDFLSQFNHMLSSRSVKKIYRATTEGLGLHSGEFTHYMEPSPRAPKKVQELQPSSAWQECKLRLFDIQNFPDKNQQEVRVELLTGRTHQIRAQLSALGAPICGDVMYGGQKKYSFEQIDLEAESLKFLDFEFTLKR